MKESFLLLFIAIFQCHLTRKRSSLTVYGPRRVGKTFYFYQIISSLLSRVAKERSVFINLEDERLLPLGIQEMHLLEEAYYELYPKNRHKAVYLFLDEIQEVDGWERFVRRLEESRKFRIFLTGSSAKLMSREIFTSLRGRTLSYRLLPLSFKEFLKFKGLDYDPHVVKYSGIRFEIKNAFSEYLEWGGYPEVTKSQVDIKHEILKNYFEMIVFRDLVERYSVRNSELMKQVLKYLLTNISNLFSVNGFYHSLEERLRPSRETLQEYLSHILETETIFLVPKFSYSRKVQEKNPKKVYCLDHGLRRVSAFLFSKDLGRLAENIVFLELFRRGYELYYWKDEKEVDFIAKKGEHSLAINVSYQDDILEREMKGFGLEFDRLYLITKDRDEEIDGINVTPLWQWLLGDNSGR